MKPDGCSKYRLLSNPNPPTSMRCCLDLRTLLNRVVLFLTLSLATGADAADEVMGFAYRADWSAERPLIAGVVTQGSGNARYLARVLGPTLEDYTARPHYPNPSLESKLAGQPVDAVNLRWGDQDGDGLTDTAPALEPIEAGSLQAGMVPFTDSDSQDCALLVEEGASIRLFTVTGPQLAVGQEVMFEWANLESGGGVKARNISVRSKFRNGQRDRLGFTLPKGGAATVIVTARGPSLSGLIGSLPHLSDPVIGLYDVGGQRIAYNDDWHAQTEAGVSAQDIVNAINASGLPSFAANSKDAAILVTLGPGDYEVSLWGGLEGSQTDGEVVLAVTLVP